MLSGCDVTPCDGLTHLRARARTVAYKLCANGRSGGMTDELSDLGSDKTLLLVDDDEPFLRRLAKAMEKRGFEVEMAGSVAAGKAIATAARRPMPFAICGWRMAMGWMWSRSSAKSAPIAVWWC